MQVTGPAVPPVQKQTLEQSESTAQRSPAVRMGSISLNILFPEVNPDQQCLPTSFKKTKQMPKRHGFTWSGILASFGLCSYVYIKALQASLLDASQCPTNCPGKAASALSFQSMLGVQQQTSVLPSLPHHYTLKKVWDPSGSCVPSVSAGHGFWRARLLRCWPLP